MLAIETKYLGPTNFRGARVRAKAVDGQSATIASRPSTPISPSCASPERSSP